MKNKAAQELGKLGGQATKKKHGTAHYRKLAEHMNRVRAEKRPSDTKLNSAEQ
jgi:hypothetical protein